MTDAFVSPAEQFQSIEDRLRLLVESTKQLTTLAHQQNGRLAALQLAVLSLISTHPDPERLSLYLPVHEETLRPLVTPASLKLFEDELQVLKAAVEGALGRPRP